MATKTQRKVKYLRRRAHALRIDYRKRGSAKRARAIVEFAEKYLDTPLLPYQKEVAMRVLSDDVPTRAKCPTCGFSQRVKRDGTMGRHDVFSGDVGMQCEGTGMRYGA